jgi:putative membrane protein
MIRIRFATLAFALAAGLAALAAPATAQTGTAPKEAMSSKSLSKSDRDFLIKATHGGLYEIEASKLAIEKSRNAEVKRYAEMLVRHHTSASEELKAMGIAKPLRLPLNMSDGQKTQFNALKKLDGAEFDTDYIQKVGVEGHRIDIELFEKEIEEGRDPQVKAFASKMLPTLKSHLAAAEKLGGATPAAK